jgi:aminopeptidase YwaD
VNADDAGFKQGRTVYSYYECSHQLEAKSEKIFQQFNGLVRGEPWFNGDHMVFVQNQVPALAFTSEYMAELMKTVTHTSLDTPENIDYHKLVELVDSLNALIRSF